MDNSRKPARSARAAAHFVADFDSATAMLKALSCSLRGDVFRDMGMPAPLRPAAVAANRLPARLRRAIYAIAGRLEAVPPRDLERFDVQQVARWACSLYPARRYPAAFIGSTNGAANHLAAALGVPWLPQTWLIPVRRKAQDADDVEAELAEMAPVGRAFAERNPDLVLHHMHDANQDRLMIRYMSYFRIKQRLLGEAYRTFLQHHLEPGATIFVLDCRLSWPVTTLGERYFFQHGGAGGLDPEEAVAGDSPRIAQMLERRNSRFARWHAPAPDDRRPEAEWGFDDALAEDLVETFGKHYRIVRIVFDEPEDLSPFVADLLAWWYERCGMPARTLLIDSFILQEPGLARRLPAVPFWTKFCVTPSLENARAYVEARAPFDRVLATLFAHGTESIGFAPPEQWRPVLQTAQQEGHFIGIDESVYPADLAVYFRYARTLERLAATGSEPPSLPLAALFDYLRTKGSGPRVRIEGSVRHAARVLDPDQ